ncbi:MAG TPA: sodium:solute symporter family protein [Methanothrix sp.]|nr:sodium:solute symporter family protein [Methanothrix sp.]
MVDDAALTGLVLAGYLLAMVAVGAMAARRSETPEGFFLAGRSLSPAILTATLAATILGASSTLGMAGLGFSEGMTGAWWLLSGTLGLVALSLFLAERVRKAGCFTLPELLAQKYDRRVGLGASALILVSWVGIIAAQIVASGKLLGVLFGPGQEAFMAASALVFVGYTALGGQRSIVKTDAVQLLILLFGLLIISIRAIDLAGPGVLAGQSFPTSAARGGTEVASLIVVVGSAYLAGPDIYSRLFSATDPKTAKKSALAAALILVPLAFLITGLGISARILFPAIRPEEALPVLMAETLSPLGAGIAAAALLSALISSADTTLLTATSILTLDLYRAARPGAGENEILRASRVGTVLIGGVALLSALRLPEIIGSLLSAYTVFAGGLIVPVVAGFWRERLRLTPAGALAALIGGGGAALLFGAEMPLLGMGVSAVLLFIVSWLFGSPPILLQSRRDIMRRSRSR